MSNCLRIGIGIGSGDVFWVQVNEALYHRSLLHDAKLIPIIRTNFGGALTSDERNALLEEIVSQELDVLIGWSFAESLAYEVLDMGVPIVHLFETVIRHPLSVSPIGLKKIAEKLTGYVAKLLPNQGQVLAIGGLLRPDLPDDGRSRVAGIRKAIREFTNMRLHHIPTDWSHEPARQQITADLERWQQPIDGVFGLSDSLALIGREVALKLGLCHEKTPIVGINGDPLGLAAIIEGRMTATVETPATSFANQAFDIAVKIATGQVYPAHYRFNPRLITSRNVAKLTTEKLVAIANIPNHLVNFERNTQQEYQDYLETSLDISRQIGSVLDYQHLPIELARLVRTSYAYDHVQLFYWSEREQTLTLIENIEGQRITKRIPLLNAGVLSEGLIGDKPIFIPDSHRSIRYAQDLNWPETRSRVILPIRQGGKVLGLLDLHAFRVIHCTQQHLMGLQSLADQIGVAIRNAQLYAEALEAKQVAEKADRLKTRLLANVSHELRNPLHIILSSVGRLEVLFASQDEMKQIESNAIYLLRLINDLVDLSRAEIDELHIMPEVIEPVSFLTDVFESMADNNAEEGVRWRLELPERLPMIQADPIRLRQILLNLLSNSEKYTSIGEIRLGADVAAPYFHIWVEDTGSGIPSEQQHLIFEPFNTVRHNSLGRDGVGLGLSIARRLVALHGGLMTVDSHLDAGSTFHIYLPLSNLDNTPIPSNSEIQPILLIVSSREELSPDLLDYAYRRGLDRFQVKAYGDVDKILSKGLPAGIVWDADRASETEWQIIQQLRSDAQLCNLPFLMYGQISDEVPASGSRVTSVLLKPVRPKTLLSVINGIFKSDESGVILIVDDDMETRSIYQKLLSEQFPEYTCRTAENGKVALDVLESIVPRLVILDLMMPEIDGFEVIQWMRNNRRTRDVPIAILSGKILTLEDIKRLEPYQKVTFQSKDVLSDGELVTSLQQMLLDNHVLPPQTSAVVKRALAYIHQQYEQPLSRLEIAQTVGVSENYLTSIFHQELGVSLWDYLNRYRVLQAKELLRNTHESIANISSQVGFDDPAYFSRVFRRYVGQSPRVYRNSSDSELESPK